MNTKFLTIRQAAAAGPISEHHLRMLCKRGELPGIYSGTRFLVNYGQLLEKLEQESTKGGQAHDRQDL